MPMIRILTTLPITYCKTPFQILSPWSATSKASSCSKRGKNQNIPSKTLVKLQVQVNVKVYNSLYKQMLVNVTVESQRLISLGNDNSHVLRMRKSDKFG